MGQERGKAHLVSVAGGDVEIGASTQIHWGRYSLGTKNKNLKYKEDGSPTLYAGAQSPGAEKGK